MLIILFFIPKDTAFIKYENVGYSLLLGAGFILPASLYFTFFWYWLVIGYYALGDSLLCAQFGFFIIEISKADI